MPLGTWGQTGSRYAGAMAAVAGATAVRSGLAPLLGGHLPYTTFYLAVLLAAWFGGLGPAILATGVGGLLATALFLPPEGHLSLAGPEQQVSLFAFVCVALLALLLSEASRRARHQAEAGERRYRVLAEVSAALAADAPLPEALRLAAARIVPGLADWCVIRIGEPDGDGDGDGTGSTVAVVHTDPGRQPALAAIEAEPGAGAAALGCERAEVVDELIAPDATGTGAVAAHRARLHELGTRSLLQVPLSGQGRRLGLLTLGLDGPGRRYRAGDLTLADELGHRVALAVARARVEAAATQARRRSELLAGASAALGSSLDYEATLQAVARLTVPQIADWCTIDLVEPDGPCRRVATVHDDPERLAWGLAFERRYPTAADPASGVALVLRSGEPLLVPVVDAAMLAQAARDPEHLAGLQRLALRSCLCVPLAARGRVLGVLSLVTTTESGRTYGDDDLALARELAARAALAVDNARLYRDAERARRRSEESLALLETLMASAPIGMSFVDRDLRYVRINEALARTNGRPAEATLGRTLREVLPELADTIEPLYRRVISGGAPLVGQEFSGATAAEPGGARHWRIDLYPVRTAGGPVLGVGSVVVDVTEAKRFEAELRRARDAAEAANRAKDEFLAVLSHELRTPLMPILAAVSEALDWPETPAPIRPLLELTYRNVALEARLIDDLLDLTRISHGKLVLDREPLDAHTVVGQALEICQAEMRDRGLTLDLDLAAPEHHLDADPARLQQIVWNLIKNAVKFTPPGGRITIRSRGARPVGVECPAAPAADGRPCWELRVCDTGIGIDPALLGRIFVPMEQGDASVTRQFGGLGLGLAISQSLAQAHGGTLAASSAGRGQGATFTLTLPTIPAPEAAADPARAPGRAGARPVGGELGPAGGGLPGAAAPLPPLRILLVEDNADTLRVLERLLTVRGHRVTTATGVAAAQHAAEARAFAFDLILSDLGLPDGSGLELMRRLRAHTDAPAIALTGYGMEADLHRSREAGFSSHLTKPIEFAKLQAAMRRALSPAATPGG